MAVMDAFSTAVAAGDMIITYLDACASYSDEARSLYHRFKWDMRVLKEISSYFERRQAQVSHTQRMPEENLLDETARYLAVLISKVSASFAKIQAFGFWGRTLNQSLWLARRKELKDLEHELNEWTNRFDIRLLGLPPELKTIIPATHTTAKDRGSVPIALQSNMRMQEFAALAWKSKQQQIDLLRCDPPKGLLYELERNPDALCQALELDTQQVVITSRPFPPGINPGHIEFQRFMWDIGELAAALHVLDLDANVCFLKVEYFFYDMEKRRFVFVHHPPHPIDAVITLEEMIEHTSYSGTLSKHKTWVPLDQRLKLAKRLAEGVFFLHTAGFVHKNITPSSILSLQRSNLPPFLRFPYSLGDPYIMGFEMVRSENGLSVLEGAYNVQTAGHYYSEKNMSERSQQIFQHPDRLHLDEGNVKRYIKNYDVYSLGVVLLQVGLWEPINTIARRMDDDFEKWPENLCRISQELGLRTGTRYQRMVIWCLTLKGTSVVKDMEFMHEVLEPLEDMEKALT